MFEKLSFDENGLKTVALREGFHPDMMMNIFVRKLTPGETYSVESETDETAILLLGGTVEFQWNGETVSGSRANPFERKPYCLHVCRGTAVRVTAKAESEILIQQTDNEKEFAPAFYTPETCLYQEFGKGQWGGAGHRIVSTMFDYDNAPYSNMVMGEVFNQPGKWSSYPPHHHPQPEVYYYRFDKPQGFGAAFVGEEVYKSVDGSASYITSGENHQQVTAPGYEMYYVWMVRHLDGDPWYKTTRFYEDCHKWLLDEQ